MEVAMEVVMVWLKLPVMMVHGSGGGSGECDGLGDGDAGGCAGGVVDGRAEQGGAVGVTDGAV
jgi:hypothetical protein